MEQLNKQESSSLTGTILNFIVLQQLKHSFKISKPISSVLMTAQYHKEHLLLKIASLII